MKRSSMNARDRRALVWGAVLLVPPLLIIYGVQPYRRALAEIGERIDDERVELARDQAATANLSRLRLPGDEHERPTSVLPCVRSHAVQRPSISLYFETVALDSDSDPASLKSIVVPS